MLSAIMLIVLGREAGDDVADLFVREDTGGCEYLTSSKAVFFEARLLGEPGSETTPGDRGMQSWNVYED